MSNTIITLFYIEPELGLAFFYNSFIKSEYALLDDDLCYSLSFLFLLFGPGIYPLISYLSYV